MTMKSWNLADAFAIAAEMRSDEPAVVQADRRITWAELDRRTSNVAAWMIEAGAGHQGKVAIYTYNHPAYVEGLVAALKASLVPVNVNYRYQEEELRYLLDNADAEIVIVHEDFTGLLAKVLPDLTGVKGILVIGDEGSLTQAADFEAIADTDRDVTALDTVEHSGDDLFFLYTGGTTGMPKGVMWRQADLWAKLAGGGLGPSPDSEEEYRQRVENPVPLRPTLVVGPPLMHGTGLFTALISLIAGGTLVLLPNPKHFDPAEFWATLAETEANMATIVGDSFAKPLVRELDANPGRYDISSLRMVASSGVMWSEEAKQRMLEHHAGMMLVDSFSSSEALGMGLSVMTAAGPVQTAKFQLSETTRLFDESLAPLETAPGVKGLVGVGRNQPLGYYKDPEKTARTFTEVDGIRFSVPGDWAVVAEDGVTLELLGRGSVCINTGGEKVFPEEVEEVAKRHEGVRDCVVVGLPDEKWGESITAVVSPLPDVELDPDSIITFVKENLAGYKAPKHVVVVDEVYRSPSGKADYKATRDVAKSALGLA
ncbi:MAG: AMP-binding protein [Acidimicrobiia bacterium]|nr:AMP-binding protein [Acidimicrobiia bacterium]